jgi:DNA-binding NtrC family response regulator
MSIEKVVVVEDELALRLSLEAHLRQRRCDVLAVSNLAGAREALAKDTFDLVFLDVRLPNGEEGTDLLKELQTRPQRPLVVIMTAAASVESAVDCMRNGAFDYLTKPFSVNQIDFVLKKADEFSRIVRVNQFLSKETDADWELLGGSPAIERLRLLIRQVARTQATVLIQGESGTGKELVARALHKESPRASAPLIKVNCPAIPDNLIESEFFGHEKGAFTGALNKREGRFELAHGGTILLDEISEIAPGIQAKLLRVLQEREFERVGGARTIKVDVRVIATTNRHLEQAVQRKEFREDLFFRINVVPIQVPPLRDRREDILYLAEHFLHWFARKHGCAAQRLSDSCFGILTGHPWPGNVRELQNVIERAVILGGDSPVLEAAHLCLGSFSGQLAPAPVPAPAPESAASAPVCTCPAGPAAPAENPNHFPPLHELEKRHIYAALERCSNNRTQAARVLGISVRTLRNKLNEYTGQPAGGSQGPEDPEDCEGASRTLNAASP